MLAPATKNLLNNPSFLSIAPVSGSVFLNLLTALRTIKRFFQGSDEAGLFSVLNSPLNHRNIQSRPIMLLLRKPMKQYNWLPDYMQNIYQWLHYCEPTWGYTIYRKTYTPQSNAAFPRMVDLTTKYMKNAFYKDY